MMNPKIVPLALLLTTTLLGQVERKQEPPPQAATEASSFRSPILGREVSIQVWLPPGYRDPQNSARTYPVIYMLDGGKILGSGGPNPDPGIHLTEALARFVGTGKIEPIVAVFVEEVKEDGGRRDEYLPYRDAMMAPKSMEPRGKVFPDFLVGELLPYVSGRYRVTADPQKTAIGGLSYSGIAALYALINKPMAFQLGFFESPSLQSGNGQLLRDTQQLVFAGRRIAIGIGTMEAGKKADPALNKKAVQMVGTLAANLRSAYFPPEVRFTVDEGGTHDASAWERRIPEDIVFLFGTQQ
jgi:predicted alpha/beta superfamily hydrolase